MRIQRSQRSEKTWPPTQNLSSAAQAIPPLDSNRVNPHRFGPGVSGNPGGKSKYRTQFEDAFNDALVAQGGPDWEAARAKEPWAIQNICQRFAPQTQSLRLTHEVDHDGIDYTRLTDEQLRQLDSIFEQVSDQPRPLEVRDGAPPAD